MSLNVQLLEETFALIKPYGTQFAAKFYYHLFQENPQLEPLFANTNMLEQEKKLVQTLVLVVWNLRNLTYLGTILRDLGERHVRYGIIQTHYPMVGSALLKTLEFYLKTNWTPEVEQAWTDAYAAIVNLMLEGAKSSEEMEVLRNISSPSNNLPSLDSTTTLPPVTTYQQDDSEEIGELSNVELPSPNPATVSSTTTSPLNTSSKFDPKLTLILFIIICSFGIGLLYYSSYLLKGQHLIKEQPEVTTQMQQMIH